ncbi:MAG: DUF4124 domain-containing protein [Methylococcaceae bacterium]|nr:DUF4124 domain-containing protein [Methylococcaceae bacterium]
MKNPKSDSGGKSRSGNNGGQSNRPLTPRYFPRPALWRQLGWLLLIVPLLGCSEVFRWTDEGGNPHFTDRPTAGAEKLPLREPSPPTANTATGAGWVRVKKVYDGDTIILENGERVRLLGLNTPEIAGSYRDEEPGGPQARDWLSGKIAGLRVRLETDAESKDRYGRTLAHVFTADGTHINLALVKAGLATTDVFPPNLKYVDAMAAAEREAERNRAGIWGMRDYQPKPVERLNRSDAVGWQRLVGTVTALSDGRNYAGLRFGERLEVRIPKQNLRLFPALSSYLGQKLEARGWLSRQARKPALWVRHPSALLKR